jgi:zinc transporter ZupT
MALIAAQFIPLKKDSAMRLVLTFSGAYLLAVAVLELLPVVYGGSEGHQHEMGLWVMGGYLFQLLLELFSGGVEHGHSHVDDLQKKKLPLALLISLFTHALMESMPIGAIGEGSVANSLTMAIALHSFPITIVLYSILLSLKVQRLTAVIIVLLFAFMPVLGILLAGTLAPLQDAGKQLTALTLGVFLHVSTTILFESSKGHAFNLVKFASILLAFALAFLAHELI